jgi:hypothetical protein
MQGRPSDRVRSDSYIRSEGTPESSRAFVVVVFWTCLFPDLAPDRDLSAIRTL